MSNLVLVTGENDALFGEGPVSPPMKKERRADVLSPPRIDQIVKHVLTYEKSVVDELEGEGEMNKGRYKEDYKVVKENKDCIVVYGNEGVDWIKFIKV